MHKRSLFPAGLLACALFCFCSCLFSTDPGRTAGGGSDIGNGGIVAGVVRTKDGALAADVLVRLRPKDYLAPLPAGASKKSALDTMGEVRTQADGGFAFSQVDTGDYRIEILDSGKSQGTLLDIHVQPKVAKLELPESRMTPTGEIRIHIPTYSTLGSAAVYVRIQGLERLGRFANGSDLVIPNLPAGSYTLTTVSTSPTLTNLKTVTQVRSDSSTLVDDFISPCGTRACDSAVVADFLLANALPGDVGQVANANGRITDLTFTWTDSTLRFTTIGNLRRLAMVKTFRLDGPFLPDSLVAPLMDALANMDALWQLRLSASGDKAFTAIPPSIGRLTALTQLYLIGDSLAVLPEEIGNLKKLEMIFLTGNRLTQLPYSFAQLPALRELHIPFNRLEYIPDAVLKIPTLIKMDVFGNRLCNLTEAQKAMLLAVDAAPEGQVCP